MTYIVSRDTNSSYRLHSGFWADCPRDHLINSQVDGCYAFDDFAAFTGVVSGTATTFGYFGTVGYSSYQDTGDSITALVTEVNGVVRITTDTSDNDECWLTTCGASTVTGGAGFCKFNTTANSGKKIWFEARVRPSTITVGNWAVLLTEEAFAANDAFADAGTLIVKDYVGFSQVEAVATALKTSYATASGAEVVDTAVATTLVAATWYKLGIYYDPAVGMTYYLNGAAVNATPIAVSATNFPDGEELGVTIGVKNSTTTATALDVDWISFATLYA